MFVQAQFLKESPAVLSLGKLCEEIGYPHEWHPGQPPDLIENGRTSRVTPTRNTRRRLWKTGSRHCCGRQRARRVGTELPERRQPVMEGLTRESSSSTVVSPVDVAISPTNSSFRASSSKTYFETHIAKHADARKLRERHAEEILTIGWTELRLPSK